MKKIFTLIASCGFAIGLNGQTITSANFPVVGEVWLEFEDSNATNVMIQGTGAGLNWDYSTAFNVYDTSATLFESPSAAPSYMNVGVNFPTSDLAVIDHLDSTATFLESNSTGIYFDANYEPGIISDAGLGLSLDFIDFNPDRLIIPAPFSLNDTRQHDAKFELTFTPTGIPIQINLVQTSIQDFIADGSGTLITPLGTFPNVLRIKEYTYMVDSITYTPPLAPDSVGYHDTTITYTFVHANSHVILMSASVDPNTNMVTEASYFDPIVLVGEEENETLKVNAYPVPAKNEFYLTQIRPGSSVQFYDYSGKLVNEINVSNLDRTLRVETSDMAEGFYLYRVFNNKSGQYASGKFQVIK